MTDILGLFERAFPALDSPGCPTHLTNCPGHWHVEVSNEGTRFSKPLRLTDVQTTEICAGVTQYELTLVEDRFPEADLTPHRAQLHGYTRPARVRIADTVHTIPPKEAPVTYTESTPFKHVDEEGDTLTFYTDPVKANTVYLDSAQAGVYIANDDAPAVALAILQAAGIRGTHVWTATSVESAVAFLTLHVEAEARKKADAEKAAAAEADAAKLDEEAQAIREAMFGDELYARRWADLSPRIMSEYRAAARKARELHGKA